MLLLHDCLALEQELQGARGTHCFFHLDPAARAATGLQLFAGASFVAAARRTWSRP